MDDPSLDLNPEFIEENRRSNLVRPRQKFAPFTKAERQKRRQEVYRLHFENGIPAVAIADMMQVDRNTINNDLQVLYRQVGKDWDEISYTDYVAKHVSRLEAQRSRLVVYLSKIDQVNIDSLLAVERMIADIDLKLMLSLQKMGQTQNKITEVIINALNEHAEKEKLKVRWTNYDELFKISVLSRKSLDEIKNRALNRV
jgi:hypothetical protein